MCNFASASCLFLLAVGTIGCSAGPAPHVANQALYNCSNGQFYKDTLLPLNEIRYEGPVAVATADIDADGFWDVATADQDSGMFLINNLAINSQAHVGTKPNGHSQYFFAGGTPVSVAFASFTPDHFPDLALLDSAMVQVFLNAPTTAGPRAPTGFYLTPENLGGHLSPIPLYNLTPIAMATGDFDGDGKTDIAVLSAQHLRVYAGVGDGSFTGPQARLLSNGNVPAMLVAGDFDNDGLSDVAVSSDRPNTNPPHKGIIDAYLGNQGTLVGNLPVSSDLSINCAVATGDFDADGKLDLVGSYWPNGCSNYRAALNPPPGQVDTRPYYGRGDGTFEARQVNVVVGGWAATSIATGDLNGDGQLDYVLNDYWSQSGCNFHAVVLGNQAGINLEQDLPPFHCTDTDLNSRRIGALALGDFDHSGAPDVVLANHEPELGQVGNEYGSVSFMRDRGAGCREGTSYYGGAASGWSPLLTGTVHLYYIWLGDWQGQPHWQERQSLGQAYAQNLGHSSYYNILTTYFQENEDGTITHISGDVEFEGNWFANSNTNQVAFNALLDNNGQIATVPLFLSMMIPQQMPYDPHGVYVLFGPPGYVVNVGGIQYCQNGNVGAVHLRAEIQVNGELQVVQFAIAPYPDHVGNANNSDCLRDPSPNNDRVFDSIMSMLNEEILEAITDPLNGAGSDVGWNAVMPGGGEILDLCGSSWEPVALGGHQFILGKIQPNLHEAECAVSYP